MRKLLVIVLAFLVLPLSFVSCNKDSGVESGSSDGDGKFAIMEALNDSDPDRAISLIDEQEASNPSDLEFNYFRGQAYALKAGVDIYSLFPIVKMKLFEVAMTEWNSIQKYSKSSRASVGAVIAGDDLGGQKAIEKIKEQIEKIKNTPPENVKYEYELTYLSPYISNNDDSGGDVDDGSNGGDVAASDDQETSYTYYGYCSGTVKIKTNLIPEGASFQDDFGFELDRRRDCIKQIEERYKKLDPQLVKDMALAYYAARIDKIQGQSTTQKAVKGVLSLFESADVIRKLPSQEHVDLEYINKALDTLSLLYKDKKLSARLKQNSVKHVGLLAGFLMLSALKASIDFDKVEEPYDMICKIRPEVAVDQYGNFIAGLRYLVDITIETGFDEKNKKSVDKLKATLEVLPKTLSEEDKQEDIFKLRALMEESSC